MRWNLDVLQRVQFYSMRNGLTMKRFGKRIWLRRSFTTATSAVLMMSLASCSTFEFLTGRCDEEFIDVSWPATVERNGTTVTMQLSNRVSEGNVGTEVFNGLKETLITGGGPERLLRAVTWGVPAFSVNGGFIALSHTAPRSTGNAEPLEFAFDGGGWGLQSARPTLEPAISVRVDDFVARSATGSITTVRGLPLTLRVDASVSDAGGESIRIRGDAVFSFRRQTSSCS